MKGPSSALYGLGEPRGTINIITKKSQFEEQGYIQGTLGSLHPIVSSVGIASL